MPKATHEPTPSTRSAPPDFAPAIDRLRQIAAEAGNALLTEGSVHPDHALLDLCANALHHFRAANKIDEARPKPDWPRMRTEERAAFLAEKGRFMAEHREAERLAKASLHWVAKTKATTAAGIFAKAMVVRASRTGAAYLAKTLAEDLIACPGLRESLWPTEADAA